MNNASANDISMNNAAVILNVDDSDCARYAKSRVLKMAGFTVLEAATGGDALALIKQQMPDLVLLDMKLPDLSGFEVCRRIKAEPATASVLVLQTSASLIESTDRVKGLEGGADNYLAAPVESHELIANVKALLRMRNIQRELHENEERFRQLTENIGDVFWIVDPLTQQLLYVSPAYEKLWARNVPGPGDSLYTWLDLVHPTDRDRVRAAFEQLLTFANYEEEYRLQLPDGSERWISDRGFPVQNEQGVNYRVARISQDITAQKQAEQALQQASIRKDEFLATLAHELRNPLAPMRTAVELMRMQPASLEITAHARETMARQIDHLVRLVDDLLDVSRITEGKLSLRRTRVELKSIVNVALEINAPLLKAQNHQLDVQLPAGDVWLNVDSVRLSQVIGNLLHNAAKYTPAGGAIGLCAETERDKLRIVVTDNGIGIAPHQIQSIFDMFTQGERSDDRRAEGLGVGLSLVKSLVSLHGGNVYAHSAGLGLGSRFTIELPILNESRRAIEARPGAERSGAGPMNNTTNLNANTIANDNKKRIKNSAGAKEDALRILLIDDNVDAVKMLSLLLKKLGHHIEVAHDGASGLNMAQRFFPDVVLLDIGLPDMDGYEVAKALRANSRLQHARLVALTGYGQERDRQLALAAGFYRHLTKPLNINELTSLLAEAPQQAIPAQL